MTAARPVDVLVVDDDHLMRAGLAAVLSSDPTIRVVGEAADGAEALEQARRLVPDVAVMDIRMPGVDGIAATRAIAADVPRCRVLVLTTFEEDEYVIGALRAGASGFVLKRIPPEDLVHAIHAVAAGDALLSPSVTRRMIEAVIERGMDWPADDPRVAELTRREREVLALMARGLTNGEIARALTVEESTVKSHVKRVLGKVGARDRVQAVIVAFEAGVVHPGAPDDAARGRPP